MLHVYIGHNKEELGNPGNYFNALFDTSVLTDDFARMVIKGVDKTDVIDCDIMKSEFFGAFPPSRLSSGCKSLLMMCYTDWLCNYVFCGKNCDEYLIKMLKEKDVRMACARVFNPYSVGYTGRVHVLNSDSYVDNALDYCKAFNKYRFTEE